MAIKLNKNVEVDVQIRANFGGTNSSVNFLLPSRLRIIASRGEPFPENIRVPKEAYVHGRNIDLQESLQEARGRGDLTSGSYPTSQTGGGYITIQDYDYNPNIDDERRPRSLTLPFVPKEVEVIPEPKFPVMATIGRNTPYYQYTGSEKIVEFTIDWVALEQSKKDVIKSCKWLEALTQSNSYDEDPHRIMLIWGDDPLLFRDSIWIVSKAPYSLKKFELGHMEKDHYNRESELYRNGQYINTHLLPTLATQKVTLKRVSDDNLSTDDILMYDDYYNGE